MKKGDDMEDKDNKEDINPDTRGIAELFIKEQSSLEVILILTDEGPKSVKEISEEVIYDTKITDLLDKLIKFKVIDIKDDIVDITSYGKLIGEKLRNEVQNTEDKNNGEFDNIDFSKLDINGIIRLCLKCKTKEDAEKVMMQYEKYCDTPEIARKNLGYIFGHCGQEDREKLYSLFPVNHPIFGPEFGHRGDVSCTKVFKMGEKLGEEIKRKVEKK